VTRQTERARELRRDPSQAERICWELIRAHRIEGIKFRRQHPIGRYFADFACVSLKLAIEVDGEHQADQMDQDAQRTAAMEKDGWRVIRFAASEVVQNREGIWDAIQLLINGRASPPLLASPPSGGEEYEGERPSGKRA
jgi:very-short-patch-repair endonuclease